MRKLMLDHVYEHERRRSQEVLLTQPVGGGKVVDFTWAQTMDQARRMAAHLRTYGFAPGARIGILSKNTAYFVMAELAIWMAGYTTVTVHSTETETARDISHTLRHADVSLLFIGKLDAFDERAIPLGLQCVEMPLAPRTTYPLWDAIVSKSKPLTGSVGRAGTDLMFINYTSACIESPTCVMHNFSEGTLASEALARHYDNSTDSQSPHRFLAHMPLAQTFERVSIECAALVLGRSRIFFSESLDSLCQDLRRARPTSFISVPRSWLKLQQEVIRKIPEVRLNWLLRTPVMGILVRRKILRSLGLDRVVLAGSCSAPMPPPLLQWYRRLGLNVVEGRGMTEDCG